MKNNNFMGEYIFEDNGFTQHSVGMDYMLHLQFVQHEFGDIFIVRQDGRLRVDTCKKAWFLQKIVFG